MNKADVVLVKMLFDSLIEKKKKKMKTQETNILQVLENTPDFYIEMKWDFESNVIPFISQLAPTGKTFFPLYNHNIFFRHI